MKLKRLLDDNGFQLTNRELQIIEHTLFTDYSDSLLQSTEMIDVVSLRHQELFDTILEALENESTLEEGLIGDSINNVKSMFKKLSVSSLTIGVFLKLMTAFAQGKKSVNALQKELTSPPLGLKLNDILADNNRVTEIIEFSKALKVSIPSWSMKHFGGELEKTGFDKLIDLGKEFIKIASTKVQDTTQPTMSDDSVTTGNTNNKGKIGGKPITPIIAKETLEKIYSYTLKLLPGDKNNPQREKLNKTFVYLIKTIMKNKSNQNKTRQP
jgi:hypothetical protein